MISALIFSRNLFASYGDESECCHQHQADHLYNKNEANDTDPALVLTDSTLSEQPAPTTSFQFTLPRISLAKLSIIFLALASVTDVALTQMQSSDVERPRVSLGSAAISSVTDTLSPILPFAGGLDLRRDDYWATTPDGNWWDTLSSVLGQVRDAFAKDDNSNDDDDDLRIESKTAKNNKYNNNRPASRQRNNKAPKHLHVSPISRQQPFVSVEDITELSLGEVAQAFRYAVESSDADFNENKFISKLNPRVQKVIRGMQEAVKLSRGKDVRNWVRRATPESNDAKDDVDALQFAAAMRIFAEWRVVRQVPDGYKGFAVGMSLGHKDVVQNVAKIEEAVHSWLDYERDLPVLCVDGLRTPTLRELLRFEIETGVQDVNQLPRLKEKSAGMGLLWVRRQFAYQTHLFDNVMVPGRFASLKDAVMAAYAQVYNQYHGWAVQKIFNYSFQSAPEAEVIFRHMNPHRLRQVLSDQAAVKASSSSESGSSSSPSTKKNPVEQFFDDIGSEWDKLVNKILKKDKRSQAPTAVHKVRGGGDSGDVVIVDEEFVTREMVKDAQQQIAAYLDVAKPLLDTLANLFDDLNMNDPRKV